MGGGGSIRGGPTSQHTQSQISKEAGIKKSPALLWSTIVQQKLVQIRLAPDILSHSPATDPGNTKWFGETNNRYNIRRLLLLLLLSQ